MSPTRSDIKEELRGEPLLLYVKRNLIRILPDSLYRRRVVYPMRPRGRPEHPVGLCVSLSRYPDADHRSHDIRCKCEIISVCFSSFLTVFLCSVLLFQLSYFTVL